MRTRRVDNEDLSEVASVDVALTHGRQDILPTSVFDQRFIQDLSAIHPRRLGRSALAVIELMVRQLGRRTA